MAIPTSWQCPFCLHMNVQGGEVYDNEHLELIDSRHGKTALVVENWVCLYCRELTIEADWVKEVKPAPITGRSMALSPGPTLQRLQTWKLRPDSAAKPQPDYIPQGLRDDYFEACRICNLSPKSSATLARRVLQGMIRNFHGISRKTLNQEIDALKGTIEDSVWEAIDGVRRVGNIGAHMESDINLIVEVDPDEAQLLISLIEQLFAEWYVVRHDRQERMAAVKRLADEKDKQRKKPSDPG